MSQTPMSKPNDRQRLPLIRSLFEQYIERYAARDDLLTAHFSEEFCGYTGGGDFLVKDRQSWVNITRQDFAQVPGRIQIELLDMALQDLSSAVVVATGLCHIRLPGPERNMARESARLTLIFRRERGSWKIVYNGYSIPDQLVHKGEVYPIEALREQNQALQRLLQERTQELASERQKLRALMSFKDQVRWCLEKRLNGRNDMATIAQALSLSVRTLVRRLKAEGTSFSQVKDQLRQHVAQRLLEEGQQSLENIATQIGFESLSAFHRAFKTWTGNTPLAHRRVGERRKGDRRQD